MYGLASFTTDEPSDWKSRKRDARGEERTRLARARDERLGTREARTGFGFARKRGVPAAYNEFERLLKNRAISQEQYDNLIEGVKLNDYYTHNAGRWWRDSHPDSLSINHVADGGPRVSLPGGKSVPVAHGAYGIAAASAEGEPFEIRGTVSIPKDDHPEADSLKNYDTTFNPSAFDGRWNQQLFQLAPIDRGALPNQRIGSEIEYKAYEFRFTFMPIFSAIYPYNSSFQTNQASYSWAGQVGQVGTVRTVPAIVLKAHELDMVARDSGGSLPASFFANVVSTVSGNLTTTGTGLITDNTNFDSLKGPSADRTLQAAQTNITDQQPFPAFPGWTAPAIQTAYDYKSGRLPTIRIMLIYDRFGYDTPGASGSLPPQYADVLQLPTGYASSSDVGMAPVSAVYRMDTLDRWIILEDMTCHPPSDTNQFTVCMGPKEMCLPGVWNNTSNPLLTQNQQGGIYLLVCSSDEWTQLRSGAYAITGTSRIFFSDK